MIIHGWILAGSLTAADPPSPGDLERGEKIYLDRCKACHGGRGDGQTFAANALFPPPRNFTADASKKELTRERMIRSVTQGRPGTAMMPWERVLSAGDIRAVVDFIRKDLMRLPD